MLKKSIEERVMNWDWHANPDRIVVHSDDVKSVMKSKVFKEQAIDGCPAYNGKLFYMLGYYDAPFAYNVK